MTNELDQLGAVLERLTTAERLRLAADYLERGRSAMAWSIVQRVIDDARRTAASPRPGL